MDLLSLAQEKSFTQAPSIGNMRLAPPRAGTTARLRGAMISERPLVEMNAIRRPSGDHRGRVFIPVRSTIVRAVAPSAATAKRGVSYGAVKPVLGAAE